MNPTSAIQQEQVLVRQASVRSRAIARRSIWIDLDNSPHVPFFLPIINELDERGYEVLVTARDCFQVCGLADLLQLRYERVGRHYGKNILLKSMGLGIRACQLIPRALKNRPTLAISHGSRSQLLAASVLGIPSVTLGDYEFSKLFAVIQPDFMIVPQVIPSDSLRAFSGPILKYPGIKEDVYVPRFEPDMSLREQLGLTGELLVTIRPPATEAHYHVPQSDELFDEVLNHLAKVPNLKMILLPRSQRQDRTIRETRAELLASGKMLIPDHVLDGLNLIWHSDLVISGGGTMNREAAALGVPVYSIFGGRLGAVDKFLASSGRLTILETREQVRTKLRLQHRIRTPKQGPSEAHALDSIVEHLINIVEGKCQLPH
jgi:uncharacterized protein